LTSVALVGTAGVYYVIQAPANSHAASSRKLPPLARVKPQQSPVATPTDASTRTSTRTRTKGSANKHRSGNRSRPRDTSRSGNKRASENSSPAGAAGGSPGGAAVSYATPTDLAKALGRFAGCNKVEVTAPYEGQCHGFDQKRVLANLWIFITDRFPGGRTALLSRLNGRYTAVSAPNWIVVVTASFTDTPARDAARIAGEVQQKIGGRIEILS
jgi:hypothetical protein